MSLIPKYPHGYDLSILNTSYHKSMKLQDGTYTKDFMMILYKDNVTGKKEHCIIYEPTYIFYKLKDGADVDVSHNLFYIEKDKVEPVECKAKILLKTIAEITGNMEFFKDNANSGNYFANRALHTIPSIFSSDTNLEDHYRERFSREYVNKKTTINKAYFDIEVDTIDIQDMPEMGECPVNAITLIDDASGTLTTFLLRNAQNPLIEEFETIFAEESTREAFFEEMREFIKENVSGEEKYKKFNLDQLKFTFNFYDVEAHLIIDFFRVVNKLRPDFLLAWNMAFDIPYLIERCNVLGLNPADVLCCPEYEEKYCNYYVDNEHIMEYELRGDYYDIASDTIYIDLLIQFASRRKGQGAFPNFKLDTAANIITDGAVRKLNYSHITSNLSLLPYKDFKTFVLYNIMDVVAEKAIEETTHDINFIYQSCRDYNTRYSKGHRQTVYLTNLTRKFFYENGYILGNNVNTGVSVKYPGAMVGDPTHNSDYSKMKDDYGQVYNLVNNADDFDYKALYPNTADQHNTAPDTIIGKIFIDNKVNPAENPYHNAQYDRGGQFLEDLVTDNPLEFGKRWLHFGNVYEVLEDIDEYFNINPPQYQTKLYSEDGLVIPFNIHPDSPNRIYLPMEYLEDGELIKPFLISDKDQKEVIEMALNQIET